MEKEDLARVTVFRFDPSKDDKPRYEVFDNLPYKAMRVTDVLNYIYQNIDSTLVYRYSCRIGLCDACLMKVNGKVEVACKKLAEKEMLIEPLDKFVVLKDLVGDFSRTKRKSEPKEGR
jgi:succinate dehydrogenase/fumarate reductase iron-sulfur protein